MQILLLAAFSFVPCAFALADGASLYVANCSACHGEGGKGPVLRKDGLLRTVGTGYFIRTMRHGRPVLGCPSFEGRLDEDEITGIAVHIKSLQEKEDLEVPAHEVAVRLSERGERLFALCGGCHGLEGEGAMGPPLLDPGFLQSITDAELRRTIMWGRPGTPMKGYLKGMGGLAELSAGEIDEIISYMRFRQSAQKP